MENEETRDLEPKTAPSPDGRFLLPGYRPPSGPRPEPSGKEVPRRSPAATSAGPFAETAIGRRSRLAEGIARWVFLAMAACLVMPIIAIVVYLVSKAWPVLSWSFLTRNPENGMRAGGIYPALIGTFYAVGGSLVISAPIGVLAAVYLNEYAKDNWFTRTINLAVVNLAGVPSIVHGLFGLGAFVYAARFGKSVIAASLTIAIMTLPVIIAATKEALGAVPVAFREACWNVGATKWQTIRTIVLPNSISGILTGVILEVARAAGETAPILFTGALFYMQVEPTLFPYRLTDQFMALSYHLFVISQNVPNVPEPIPFATAVVLLGLVVAVNSTSIVLRVYLRSRKKW